MTPKGGGSCLSARGQGRGGSLRGVNPAGAKRRSAQLAAAKGFLRPGTGFVGGEVAWVDGSLGESRPSEQGGLGSWLERRGEPGPCRVPEHLTLVTSPVPGPPLGRTCPPGSSPTNAVDGPDGQGKYD